ncbi:hypothetical protein [Nonomuraea sp. NPDC049480]|uniref:hypothetical protein n=1 Tax=Nonomuraea sp. NPDC049480 TaxID=3364353 RepID=UPI003795BE33
MLTDHLSTETTHERRAAISRLGRAPQALTEAAVSTGASEEVLYRAAEQARELTTLPPSGAAPSASPTKARPATATAASAPCSWTS